MFSDKLYFTVILSLSLSFSFCDESQSHKSAYEKSREKSSSIVKLRYRSVDVIQFNRVFFLPLDCTIYSMSTVVQTKRIEPSSSEDESIRAISSCYRKEFALCLFAHAFVSDVLIIVLRPASDEQVMFNCDTESVLWRLKLHSVHQRYMRRKSQWTGDL